MKSVLFLAEIVLIYINAINCTTQLGHLSKHNFFTDYIGLVVSISKSQNCKLLLTRELSIYTVVSISIN
jgi:hypothetical protein